MNFRSILLRVTVAAVLALAALSVAAAPAMAQAIKVDPKLPPYAKVSGVSGNLNSVGSDTLNNLMTLWSEAFHKAYPNVNVQIEGKGSSTAPPALIQGTSQLGPMSRQMKSSELEKFEARYGFKPTAIGVALDTLAVYVHKDNPLDGASLQEVDAIFSKTYKGGLSAIATWGGLGLQGRWNNAPISLYGRNSASGTYGFFKEHALFKGDYSDSVKEQPGSASVVQGVETDLHGVGYSGIGYKTSGVKVLALSMKKGETTYLPSYENALSGKYPLARLLYIYVAIPPNKKPDRLTSEFLKLVLSREGQEIVVKDGYLPLPASIAAKQRMLVQ